MANRLFNSQFLYGFERMPVMLNMRVTFGASGAPTLDSNTDGGIASITRNSAGRYTIVLQDVYNKLMGVNMVQLAASAEAAPIRRVVSQTVSSTKTIVIQYLAVDNSTATDPASGEQLFMQIVLGNSSVPA